LGSLLGSMEKLSRFKGPSVYMAGAFSKACLGMVSGILVARLVTPTELGAFQTVMLVLTYASFLQLGVFNGLNRQYAFLLGRGEEQRAQDMVNASFRMTHLAGFLQVLAGVGFCAWLYYAAADRLLLWGALVILPALFLTPYLAHFDVTYRTSQHFQTLGYFLSFEGFFMLLSVGFAWLWGYLGLFLRQLAGTFIGVWLRRQYVPVRVNGKGTLSDILELIRIGGPLLISGYIFSILAVADRSVIAYWRGPEAVGIYSVAGIVISVFMIIPVMVGPVLNPKAAAAFGRVGHPHSLRRFIWISLLMHGVLALPLVIAGYFLMDRVVGSILPAYVAGIPAAKISLLTGLAICLTGPSLIFFTARRNTLYILASLLCTALVWGLGSWCLQYYDNIIYVAWIRAGVSLLLSVLVVFYALYITRPESGPGKPGD